MALMHNNPTALGIEPMLPRPFRIQQIWNETSDTFSFSLVPVEEGGGHSFAPGQFNMLYAYGVGEVPISISSDPAEAPRLRHTTRVVGPVTRALRRLKRGETMGVRGPFGSAWPVEEAKGRDLVVVAGGIGLAPLRPVLYQALAQRQAYRKVVLLYGARTPEDLLYRRELERWRGQLDLEVHVTVDRAFADWRGNVGVVTKLIGRTPFDRTDCVAMVCGPEVMMRFAVLELQDRGVPSDRIYVSMERNMKCAVGFCGHCQYGPLFVCKDGPVFRYDRIAKLLGMSEV
jgi:NAD(P)H-flavin reductase